jgi:predicted HAD superfamily phosphohydrolase YqeG
VSEAKSELDEIRIMQPITRGQAELGTGIVNLNYLGDQDTRPEFVRLRAASQKAQLAVEQIALIGDRLAARGSVTDKARGIVRLRFSYVDPDGPAQVHLARAENPRRR